MRSKEAADLAGVTVRTLRYYHQREVLPEPPRQQNGYHSYGMVDVARVLRIKRMASLGLSLDQIKAILSSETEQNEADTVAILNELDSELSYQIEQLEARRHIIAQLKAEASSGANPVIDASPRIGSHLAQLKQHGSNELFTQMELAQLMLLDEQAGGQDALAATMKLYDMFDQSDFMDKYVSINNEVLALPADASEKRIEELVQQTVSLLVPQLQAFINKHGTYDEEDEEQASHLRSLIETYDNEVLNDAQHRVSQLCVERIAEELGIAISSQLNS